MGTKRILFSMLLVAAGLAAVAAPLPGLAAVGVYVNIAPPPPRVEIVPAPRMGHVWVPGYWDWRGRRHVWVQGYWVRERQGYMYQPHRWVERDGRWYLDRGHWDRPAHHDRDHDGVPDRFDRRPGDPHRR